MNSNHAYAFLVVVLCFVAVIAVDAVSTAGTPVASAMVRVW